jgi:hypothetical protein
MRKRGLKSFVTKEKETDKNGAYLHLRTLLLLASAFASLLVAIPTLAGSASPDSGIVGTVPYHADDLAAVQKDIDSTMEELLNPSMAEYHKSISGRIDSDRALLVDMQNQCVRVFDPQSMVPVAYSWTGFQNAAYSPGFGPGACLDERFPSGFMKRVAAASCSKGGEFRLPLAPGRYAVSVGASLAGSGERKWWQIVEVKPLEWLKLLPASDQFRKTCNSSSDCSTNHICRSPRKFSARDGRPLEFSSKEGGMCEPTCNADKDCYYGTVCRVDGSEVPVANACKETVRTPPPRYSSGVQGTVGFPAGVHGDTEPALPVEEFLCVKGFPEGSSYMVACAACQDSDGAFVLPLPPGRYNLEFDMQRPNRDRRSVDVSPGKWVQIHTPESVKN